MSVPMYKIDRILIVDGDPEMVPLVETLPSSHTASITAAATLGEGVRLAASQRFDVIILDHALPDGQGLDKVPELISQDRLRPILYVNSQAGSHTAIEAIKRGAFDYLAKPLDSGLLQQRLQEALEYRHLTRMPVLLDSPGGGDKDSDVLVGRCRAMQEVYKSIGRLSGLDAPVLIEGEVGTGKELIARTIHHYGPRRDRPFLKIASEEFADLIRRSQTPEGSHLSTGSLAQLLPQCAGGTVLLEELGGLSNASQLRLLAALQNQAISEAHREVRFIMSTSVPGRLLLQRGGLRSDLYYFLCPYTVQVPALRDRGGDFELLVAHFMQSLACVIAPNEEQGPPRVSATAMTLLRNHDWPGNLAQLRSVLQSLLLETRGAVLSTAALRNALERGGGDVAATSPARAVAYPLVSPQSAVRSDTAHSSAACADGLASLWDLSEFIGERLRGGTDRLYEDAVAELEQTLLRLVLQHTRGNQAQAAKFLGITRTSLRKKIATAHIDLARLSETGSVSD